MAGTRRNFSDAGARQAYVDGCVALDTAMSGITVAQAATALRDAVPSLRFVGSDQELSYYDLFVLWHVAAMSVQRGLPGQNAAHSGPIFLPWHRHYMVLLEQWLQIVLGDANFGIPYWDWAADGDLPTAQQWQASTWSDDGLGPSRGTVNSGALADMTVRIYQSPTSGNIVSDPAGRRLQREAGQHWRSEFQTLPTTASVAVAMADPDYDHSPWEADTRAHRALLEGWEPADPNRLVDLHNLVHVWIGGDMGPGTSPNDPAFFLNHCNVDRIWEAWMAQHGRNYSPGSGVGPAGHRVDSVMWTLFGESRTPEQVLEPATFYDYDSLQVS